MDELHKVHGRCIALYVSVPALAIAAAVICGRFFHFLPPAGLVAAVCCLTPLACARLRWKLWKKRDILFSASELESMPAQIFFWAIPAETAFSVIAIGFIFSG